MNTALLIIDVQNDYFEDGAMSLIGSDNASENIKLLLQKFRTENQPVLHIQHIATSPGATFFIPNTIGAEIHANVKPLDDEKVIIKHYPNSFRETDLLDHLKSLDITNLVICGMMTHMCIDATTRAAKDLGFNCTLIADACATKDLEINGTIVTAENIQNSFLAALNYFYSTVTNTNKYIGEN
ncbi:MAG TPA: cysteine hydrolase family protein [Paludibacter sp.]|nr:cysteine hydrolase family protein [Paludibacter sp.]